MKKKLLKVFGITLLCFAAVLAVSFAVMDRLYDGRFGFGTWINGIYATGLTPAEVTRSLDDRLNSDGGLPTVVILIGRNNRRLPVSAEELDIKTSYAASVKRLYSSQSPLTLIKGIVAGNHLEAETKTTFDMAALEAAVDGWDIFTDELSDGVSIEETPEGYQLIARTADQPNREMIIETAAEGIENGEFFVSLDVDGSCYDIYELTEEDDSLIKTWEAIERTRLEALTYKIGDDEIVLDPSVTDQWIMTAAELEAAQKKGAGNPAASSGRALDGGEEADAEEEPLEELYLIDGEITELPNDASELNGFAVDSDGDLIIKGSDIADFVKGLCDKYDTYGKERDFKTADGRIVRVPAGTYGNKIDEEAETRWLMEAVKNRSAEVHEPILSHEANFMGEDDIGGTYIEVDIGKQELYYFVNGRIDTKLPVVTGCASLHRDTPPGVYSIYYMQRNRTLRGEGYESFVRYWIAFYGNYGIHDASWRGSFGGNIYISSGSHGCVNIASAEAGPLYQKLEVGVPVIVHE